MSIRWTEMAKNDTFGKKSSKMADFYIKIKKNLWLSIFCDLKISRINNRGVGTIGGVGNFEEKTTSILYLL